MSWPSAAPPLTPSPPPKPPRHTTSQDKEPPGQRRQPEIPAARLKRVNRGLTNLTYYMRKTLGPRAPALATTAPFNPLDVEIVAVEARAKVRPAPGYGG